jgi:hypothetical protein
VACPQHSRAQPQKAQRQQQLKETAFSFAPS